MKQFDIKNNPGSILIHMTADNSKYTVSYDHGKLVFQNDTRKYIIPKNVGYKLQYDKQDPNTNKNKYLVEDVRRMYRDTTSTDFGLTNKVDVAISSKHMSEEIIVNGINDYIPVIAPNGVIIYVNGNIVPSGTMIDNGDKVKFELTASETTNTNLTFNMAIGDIAKTVSLKTIAQIFGIQSTTKYDLFNDASCVAAYTFDNKPVYSVSKIVFNSIRISGTWGFFGDLQFWNNGIVYDVKAYRVDQLHARLELNGVIIGNATLSSSWVNGAYWSLHGLFKSSINAGSVNSNGVLDSINQTVTIQFINPLDIDMVSYISTFPYETDRQNKIETRFYSTTNELLFTNNDTKAYTRDEYRVLPEGGYAFDSNNKYHLSNTNLNYSIGKFGNAISTSSSMFLNLPETLATYFGTKDFSLSLWVKPNSLPVINNIIFATQGSNSIGFLGIYIRNNKLNCSLFNGSSRPEVIHEDSIVINTWYHLTCVKKANVYTLYLNGIKSNTTLSNTLSIGAGDIRIGQNPGAPTLEYFDGQIDQVRFFNRALTDVEVTTLYTEK